jgi:hypothetical protein
LRNGFIFARPHAVTINRLKAHTVLYLFDALGFSVVPCEYRGEEFMTIQELKAVVPSEKTAAKVHVKYRNMEGKNEDGTLVTMLLDQINYRTKRQGLR